MYIMQLSECRVIGDIEIWAEREGGMKLTNPQ